MAYDIVYVLRSDVEPDELTYSLRSVCKNFPYRRIYFIGGKPDGINPDVWIQHKQSGIAVWEKSTSSIELACRTKSITDNFWLFNDDFFIMQKCDGVKYWYNGTLRQRIEEIQFRRGSSLYTRMLERTLDELREDGFKEFNYAVHVPMLINKKKALKVISQYKSPMFRSMYGNVCSVGGTSKPDVKVFHVEEEPNKRARFLSTSDTAFKKGKVGEYIRSKFPEPCKYEDIYYSTVLEQ